MSFNRWVPAAVFVLGTAAGFVSGAKASDSYRPVRINEIYTGAPDWVELINIGETAIDIGGWKLRTWFKGMEEFQWEHEPVVFRPGTVLESGAFLMAGENQLFSCASEGSAVLTWSDMEGVACVLEDAWGYGVDAVIAGGLFGHPDIELPPGTDFYPPYPVRSRSDVIRRVAWPDTDNGSDWICGWDASPCSLNPDQGEFTPVPNPLPATSNAGLVLTGFLITVLLILSRPKRTPIVLVLMFLSNAAYAEFATDRIIVAVIDGVRHEDVFHPEVRDRMPNLNGILMRQGTFCPLFYSGGVTMTTSAHAAMITGERLASPNNLLIRDDIYPFYPNFFEYFLSFMEDQGIPPDQLRGKTCQIYGKHTDCNNMAFGLHPGYGFPYRSRIRFPDQEAGDTGPHRDARVFQDAMEEMAVNQPDLMLLNFAQVDQRGHWGVWEHYEYSIRKADEYVRELWRRIQTDPYYKDRTTLMILTDHGRHDDAHGGYRHHGCTCYGCRHSFMLVLGPDTPAGVECSETYCLVDICQTVGVLMGIDTPFSEGRFMSGLFPEGESGKRRDMDPASLSRTEGRSRHPVIAVNGQNLAAAWMDDSSGGWDIYLRRSMDGGLSWTLTGAVPVPVEGETAHWVDLIHAQNGTLFAAESTVQDPSLATVQSGWRAHLVDLDSGFPEATGNTGLVGTPAQIAIDGASLQMVWPYFYTKVDLVPPFHSAVRVTIQDLPGTLPRTVTAADGEFLAAEPGVARRGELCHVVYQTLDDRMWNVGYARSGDAGTTWTQRYLLVPSLEIFIASPAVTVSENHVIVTFLQRITDQGKWQVMAIRSSDGGGTWAAPVGLSDPAADAAYPALMCSGNTVVCAWSAFWGRQASIHARISRDGGVTWETEQNWTPESRMAVQPDLDRIGSDLAMVWADQALGCSEIYFTRIPEVFW